MILAHKVVRQLNDAEQQRFPCHPSPDAPISIQAEQKQCAIGITINLIADAKALILDQEAGVVR